MNFAEAGFAQEVHRLRGAFAAAAVCHNLARRIELMHAARQFTQWQQVPLDVTNLVFVGLAHVENIKIIATIEPRFELPGSYLGNLEIRRGRFLTAHAEKFVVINELVDGAILTAHRAIRILAQLEFTELHAQRIKKEQAADQAVARAQNQLDGFHGLNGSDDARQHAEHAAFCARRHQAWRRRFGIQATVAGSFRHTVNGGFAKQDASIIDEITRGKIVGAVHDDVKALKQFESIGAGELRLEALNFDVGIQVGQPRAGRFALVLADVAGAKSHLPLQVGEINHIEIHQAQFAHARRGQIQAQRRSETASADQKNLGIFQLELTLHTDFRHDQVAAVAQNFFVGQAGHFRLRIGGLRGGASPRDGWHDAHHVAVFYRRSFLSHVANVFVVQIDVHKAA